MTLLLWLLLSSPTHAQVQSAFPEDAQLHFIASYALSATAVQALPHSKYRLLYASLISIGVGVLKESFDTKFDKRDLASDAAGVCSYALVHYTFRF
jgi:hypothetical protein